MVQNRRSLPTSLSGRLGTGATSSPSPSGCILHEQCSGALVPNGTGHRPPVRYPGCHLADGAESPQLPPHRGGAAGPTCFPGCSFIEHNRQCPPCGPWVAARVSPHVAFRTPTAGRNFVDRGLPSHRCDPPRNEGRRSRLGLPKESSAHPRATSEEDAQHANNNHGVRLLAARCLRAAPALYSFNAGKTYARHGRSAP
jgi:hypothetical protein